MYPFRAVEHRIAVVRAANTGISAFIAPSGQIIRHRTCSSAACSAAFRRHQGAALFTRLGDWVAWLSLGRRPHRSGRLGGHARE
jgi:apolipoprotein N-acyltransferase